MTGATLPQSPAAQGSMLAFWRQKRGFAEGADIDKDRERREVARMFKAANAVLAVVGAPDNVHRLLCALIGVSGGQVVFEASDAEIGREAYADNRKTNTLKMWTRRARNTLAKWQHKTGWRIVTISPGGRTGTKKNYTYEPTVFDFPLLEVIAEVAQARDMRQAAESCVIELLDDNREVKRERFGNRPRTEGEAMMERCRKAALTYAEKMCVEALHMQPIGTPRKKALAGIEKLADVFTNEMHSFLLDLARTGKTHKERAAEKAREQKAKSQEKQEIGPKG